MLGHAEQITETHVPVARALRTYALAPDVHPSGARARDIDHLMKQNGVPYSRRKHLFSSLARLVLLGFVEKTRDAAQGMQRYRLLPGRAVPAFPKCDLSGVPAAWGRRRSNKERLADLLAERAERELEAAAEAGRAAVTPPGEDGRMQIIAHADALRIAIGGVLAGGTLPAATGKAALAALAAVERLVALLEK